MSTILYLKNLLKDKDVASITPTSKYGIRTVCQSIDFQKDNVYVEYGPATGVFSNYILHKMTPGSKLILIETNPTFVSVLRKKMNDPRVMVYEDSAEKVEHLLQKSSVEKADYIISGIPFSLMEEQVRHQIIRQSSSVLDQKGTFLAYQTFFQKDKHLKNYLEKYFAHCSDSFVIRNIPPLRIYQAGN